MPDGERLDGWKAIGNYFGRDRTTALRWARERGLPVHRVPGGRTSTVYAVRSELKLWLGSDGGDARAPIGPVTAVQLAPIPPRFILFGTVLATIFAALATASLSRDAANAPVGVKVVAAASRGEQTHARDFAQALTADLARFANASAGLAVYESDAATKRPADYTVRTDIDSTANGLAVQARLVSENDGAVVWSRRTEQGQENIAVLRERVAANVVRILRCSFSMLEDERRSIRPTELALMLATCQALMDAEPAQAAARARELANVRPDLATSWAMLAITESMLAKSLGDRSMRANARTSADRAAKIAPSRANTFLALTLGAASTHPSLIPLMEAALRESPAEPNLLLSYSVALFNLGYVEDSVAPVLSAIRSDPTCLHGRDIAVRRLAAAGRRKEALSLQAENERLWPDHPKVVTQRASMTADIGYATTDPSRKVMIRKLETESRAQPSVNYMLTRLYNRAGDRRSALNRLDRAPVDNASQQWSLLFWPDSAELRTESAFFRKMDDLGLVKMWVARNKWPDFCTERSLKYDCATEAAKLGLRAARTS